MDNIEFIADKLKINGPKVDGGLTISFDVGEYEQQKVSELLKIPQQTSLKITVQLNDK